VSKKDAPGDDVREFLRKIGRKGGQARAKKYDRETFRKWSKESGAGRPPKTRKEDQ
jgi:general stress protein YciG